MSQESFAIWDDFLKRTNNGEDLSDMFLRAFSEAVAKVKDEIKSHIANGTILEYLKPYGI